MIHNLNQDEKGYYLNCSIEHPEDETGIKTYLSLWLKDRDFRLYLTNEQVLELEIQDELTLVR